MEDHGRFQDGSDTASHMADTPEKPSMAWQTLLRALLEGEHSSWKSYLVCSPGFTGQGFILILKTSCFKSFASFWPSFISCLWTHIATLLIQTDILLQTKGSAVTRLYKLVYELMKSPQMLRWLESDTVRARARMITSTSCSEQIPYRGAHLEASGKGRECINLCSSSHY